MNLNYHHLRYFYAIVQAGGLTKAAETLNVSPSALSVQLQQLEHQLGHALFDRQGRTLVLTEAGRIALERAEAIFEAGEDLVRALKGDESTGKQTIRLGAVSTLSRNFQIEMLKPLLQRSDVRVLLRSSSMRELMTMLDAHQIDVLLTNTLPARDDQSSWSPHIISDQAISLIGPKRPPARRDIADLLRREPLIVPTAENHIRAEFDALMVRLGITPRIVAEVDDMAMLRLLAREGAGFAIAPPIVMRDELEQKILFDYGVMKGLRETFYAITPARRFPQPLLSIIIPASGKRRTASGSTDRG